MHANGTAWKGAESKPGISFARARRSKLKAYPELADTSVIHLVVAATETGGRLNSEALTLLDSAADSRAQTEPRVLRRQAARTWRSRWLGMLSIAAQDALAATLVCEGTSLLDAATGGAPACTDVWLDS